MDKKLREEASMEEKKERERGGEHKISGLGRERWMEKRVQANSAVLLLQEVRR